MGGRLASAAMACVVGLALLSAAPVEASGDDQAIPGCGHLCELGGTVTFEHPTWGPSELMVGYNRSAGGCHFAVFDAAGTERWVHRVEGCPFGAFPVSPSPDSAGNMFLTYTTMRYPGVTVLRPMIDGLDDFGSLERPDVVARFFDSTTFDVDGDGHLEIVKLSRPCVPDCASGTTYFKTYAWNGTDFFAQLCSRSQQPAVPIQATPGPGGTVIGEIPAGTCGVESNVVQLSRDTEWFAVWYEDQSGWSPVEAFELPPSEPPWPEDANPYDTAPPTTTSAPPPAPPPVVSPPSCDAYSFNDRYPIRRCDEGYAVLIIQQSLVDYGFAVDVDGYFGPGTEIAVREFQFLEGLEVDGLVGPNTWLALVGPQPGSDLDGNGIIDPDEVVWD